MDTMISARGIRLKVNMLKDSWSTGGKSCGVTTNSCRSSGPRRYMAWRSCGLFDLANSCCPVYGLVISQDGDILEAKSRLIGFTTRIEGFILWNPETRCAFNKEENVVFDVESILQVKGGG